MLRSRLFAPIVSTNAFKQVKNEVSSHAVNTTSATVASGSTSAVKPSGTSENGNKQGKHATTTNNNENANTINQINSLNHQLLVQAGYFYQNQAGVWSALPLGLRVLENLERIIDKFLQQGQRSTSEGRVIAQKVRMPVLNPAKLWKQSKRWDVMGNEMFRLKDRKGNDFCLGPTHEEMVTDIVANATHGGFGLGHLPLLLYQITHKFRDEKRPRSGLIRGREFVMKDMYSFHVDEKSLRETYEQVRHIYREIFKEIKLPVVEVLADGGNMGGSLTHEFQVVNDSVGEDILLVCDKDEKSAANSEAAIGSPNHDKAKESLTKKVNYQVISQDGNVIGYCSVSILDNRSINELKLMKAIRKRFPTSSEIKLVDSVADIKDDCLVVVDQFSQKPNEQFHQDKNPNIIIDDVLQAQEGDQCRIKDCSCGGHGILMQKKGVEVGQVFMLGTRYSSSLGAFMQDKGKKRFPLVMGCYGLGISRILASIVEVNSSAANPAIKWPANLAPFLLAVVTPPASDASHQEYTQQLSHAIEKEIISSPLLPLEIRSRPYSLVLIDDRWKDGIGKKILESQMIGIPLAIIVENNKDVKLDQSTPVERKPSILLSRGNSENLIDTSAKAVVKEIEKLFS